MPTIPNYFDHIVHRVDEKGKAFCNATKTGKGASQVDDEVNCNKCQFFIKNRGKLEIKRKSEAKSKNPQVFEKDDLGE